MNRLVALAVLSVFLLTCGSVQAEPEAAVQAHFKNLLVATIAGDRDRFVVDCDDAMKAITAEKLESVSKRIEPRAKGGYDADYLGELKQGGYTVHLWRLRFKDGGDDFLATMSLKDGKVGGFFLH